MWPCLHSSDLNWATSFGIREDDVRKQIPLPPTFFHSQVQRNRRLITQDMPLIISCQMGKENEIGLTYMNKTKCRSL